MHRFSFITTLIFLTLLPLGSKAEIREVTLSLEELNAYAQQHVRDDFAYSGLARFYNGMAAFIVTSQNVQKISEDTQILDSNQWLAIVGHYKVLVLQKPQLNISFDGEKIQATLPNQSDAPLMIDGYLLSKSELSRLDPALGKLKYAHLWLPFKLMSVAFDRLLLAINSVHSFGWGISIILLSLLFKIFILPANILLVKSQRKISHIQAKLAPALEDIKTNYSGEEAHEKFMATHKQHGVTPFYTLKPLLLTLLPFPFSICIFNVLGEMDQIIGDSFLWVSDLTRPDVIFDFGFHIPLLGSGLNLLPIIMTLLTIGAAVFHSNKIITAKENRKQKINLYLLATGLFILFYPFPATMVLYWTCANIWQVIQQRFIKIG